jgi:hypothetical protein
MDLNNGSRIWVEGSEHWTSVFPTVSFWYDVSWICVVVFYYNCLLSRLHILFYIFFFFKYPDNLTTIGIVI